MEILTYIRELGSASLTIFWLPVALWTLMGLLAIAVMKYSEHAHSVFQYHGRIALLCALPAGIIFSILNHWINSFTQINSQFATKFIVIQSPITVSAGLEKLAFNWSDPAFLAGLLMSIFMLISILLLARAAVNFLSLHDFSKNLRKIRLSNIPGISESNVQFAGQFTPKIDVAFSKITEVPFTFGSLRPVIVIPCELKQQSTDKLNMAIRHELMHIKHRDFAINSFMMVVKALFWFHPLIHKLYHGLKEYREISCDTEVLTDTSISKKSYAKLLVELAHKNVIKNTPAVSMAVNSSNLKKRIQVMSSQKNHPTMFKTSFYIMLVSVLFMTGIMACSDIQDSGITNRDIENVQSEMAENGQKVHPLYVLDGEVIELQKYQNMLSRIKTKYIESVNVLKGEKAIQKYGDKAKNGVIEFQLIDKEKAFNDLKPPPTPARFNADEDYFVVVENMPELMGGMESLQECTEYPELAKKAGIEGRVIIQFIVNENGRVENPNVIRGIGGGADEEALRCVKQAEFKPGRQRGEPVRVQYSLPIIFKLQGSDSIRKEESSVYMETPKVDGKKLEIRNLTYLNDGTIQGVIFDNLKNQPLPGVNVVVKGTTQGTSTDRDGKFSIRNVSPDNLKLHISYIGYQSFITEIKQKK